MSQQLLQDIYTDVISNSNFGIAVKNNNTGSWIMPFTTYAQMQQQGYNSIDAWFSAIEQKGNKDITVYLKRKSGNSSVYVKNKSVHLIVPNTTGGDSSTNAQVAFSGNSGNAPVLVKTQQKSHAMSVDDTNGLLGGMNMQVMDMYSRADKYNETKQNLQSETQTTKQITADNNKLQREALQKDFTISRLEDKIEALKETHAREISDAIKPTFSDKSVETANSFLPMIFGAVEQFTASRGLNAPAQQQQQLPKEELFSEEKTEFLNLIKTEDIPDSYCVLLKSVLDNVLIDGNIALELQKLAQPIPQN
jgi:hypothetical protein